ncbi:integrase [Janthinobacterium sp.]|uniref:integrase n=1 Tax=Janthinobacterium sp. TaxID=1871054 RepID=UPI00293D58D0|nr:integrase [Janthinobacterium sp.]
MIREEETPALRAADITREELQRFAAVATIDDPDGFRALLAELIQERSRAAALATVPDGQADGVAALLAAQAARLVSATPWEMNPGELQRGRALMLQQFADPGNVSVAEFARLAGKSRAQIYNDVHARRCLALSIGGRGLRIPDFQLDPLARQLTQALLREAPGVEEWTLYSMLIEANEALGGVSPVHIRDKKRLPRVLAVLLAELGVHAGAALD